MLLCGSRTVNDLKKFRRLIFFPSCVVHGWSFIKSFKSIIFKNKAFNSKLIILAYTFKLVKKKTLRIVYN